jgi:hypothetical protein
MFWIEESDGRDTIGGGWSRQARWWWLLREEGDASESVGAAPRVMMMRSVFVLAQPPRGEACLVRGRSKWEADGWGRMKGAGGLFRKYSGVIRTKVLLLHLLQSCRRPVAHAAGRSMQPAF